MNSIIPDSGGAAHPALHEFSPAGRADRPSLGSAAVLQSQRLRSVAPLPGLIVALRLHLPFGPQAFWVLLALSDETR
jgi:hypothetical protein